MSWWPMAHQTSHPCAQRALLQPYSQAMLLVLIILIAFIAFTSSVGAGGRRLCAFWLL